MQSVSAGFVAAATGAVQEIVSYLEISWDGTGGVADARGAAGWWNETPYLRSHGGQLGIKPPGVRLVPAGDIGRLTVVLGNTTQRFSPYNAGAALTAYISGAVGLAGRPIRLWQGFVFGGATEYVCIFTGVIDTWDESTPEGTMTLQCRDWGYRYLQNKKSSGVASDMLPNTWAAYVATLGGITAITQDTGIFHIPLAWLDDESVVEEIWQTWEADGGVAWTNQLGRVICQNALHWAGQAAVWTFTPGTFTEAKPALNLADVATQVIVEWAARDVGTSEVLYELDRPKVIMPGQTESWTARFRQAAYSISGPNADEPYNDYAAQSFGGADMTAQLLVYLENSCAQQTTVVVQNDSLTAAARLTVLRVRGLPLIGGPTEQVKADASPAPFDYPRVRSLRGNAYVQTGIQGKALAELLAVRCRRMRPTWKLKDVFGVPHLELGDRVTIQESWQLGAVSRTGIVVGISWTGDLSGYKQEIAVWDDTDLTAYSDYFVIGQSALGEHARAYY